jgi:hypothetical protein
MDIHIYCPWCLSAIQSVVCLMRIRLIKPGPGRDIDGVERYGMRYIFDCERPSCKYNELHLTEDFDELVRLMREGRK